MTVTRDVVYDLLPAYFAGDASPDSRALVESFLETDAEFAAMAARFKRLLGRGSGAAPTDDHTAVRTLDRARTAARRRAEFRGLAIGYAVATAALIAAGLSGFRQDASFIIAAAFGATAALCGAGWYLVDRKPEWVETFGRHSGL